MKRWKTLAKWLTLGVLVLAAAAWLVLQLPSFGGVAEGARLALFARDTSKVEALAAELRALGAPRVVLVQGESLPQTPKS